MTNEKAIYFLDKRKKELLEKQDSKEGFEFIKALAEIRSLEMAIKALEQQPCIEDYPTCTECEHYDRDKHYCPRFCQVIKDALAEVQPKKGKWIKIQSGDKDFPESIVCSRCKNENSHLDFDEHSVPIGKVFVTSKYCPNCGAEMEVEDEVGHD